MTKRTLEGTSRKRKRVSGFRVRMRSHTGRRVIRRAFPYPRLSSSSPPV